MKKGVNLEKGNSFLLLITLIYLFLIDRLRRTMRKVVRLCKIERFEGLSQLNKPKPIKLLFTTTVS